MGVRLGLASSKDLAIQLAIASAVAIEHRTVASVVLLTIQHIHDEGGLEGFKMPAAADF